MTNHVRSFQGYIVARVNENDGEKYKYKEAKSDSPEDVKSSEIRFTFKDQKLLNLWKNEVCGQVSDGAWENSRGTEWLWENSSAVLSDENSLKVRLMSKVKKKNYPIWKELHQYVGDRMREECGFKDDAELKAACDELQKIIANPVEDDGIFKENQAHAADKAKVKKDSIKALIEEWPDAVKWDKTYDWNIGEFQLKDIKDYNPYTVKPIEGKPGRFHLYTKSGMKPASVTSFTAKKFGDLVKHLSSLHNDFDEEEKKEDKE